MKPTLSRIAQISMTARDMPRAIAFYRDTLGMKHLFDAGPGLSFFDCDGIRLMLSLPEKGGEAGASSILYFKVDDVHATFRELAGRGVAFERPPHLVARTPAHALWMAFLRDSEGNLLAITSEQPLEAGGRADAP